MGMTRKPGEPIYLKRHMLGLVLALVSPIVLPLLYHNYVGPLSFATRFVAGLLIAYLLFRVEPVDGKTLNAVLVERLTSAWPSSLGSAFTWMRIAWNERVAGSLGWPDL